MSLLSYHAPRGLRDCGRRLISTAIIGLLVVISGCADHSGPTGGRVIFDDGAPVQTGVVEFRSLLGEWKRSGHISRDGTFLLKEGEQVAGLPPADYEVIVAQVIITEQLAAADHTHGKNVPLRYADYHTSGLSHTVEPGETGPIEIVVEAK